MKGTQFHTHVRSCLAGRMALRVEAHISMTALHESWPIGSSQVALLVSSRTPNWTYVASRLTYDLRSPHFEPPTSRISVVARTVVGRHSPFGRRQPCSSGKYFLAPVSERASMQMSESSSVLDECLYSVPRSHSSAKQPASQAAILCESSRRWWGCTHNIGCCRSPDAIQNRAHDLTERSRCMTA